MPSINELHRGKNTEECKTTVTEAFHDLLIERAHAAGCTPSDLIRDALFVVFTGETYSDHVAKDRRAALKSEGRVLG